MRGFCGGAGRRPQPGGDIYKEGGYIGLRLGKTSRWSPVPFPMAAEACLWTWRPGPVCLGDSMGSRGKGEAGVLGGKIAEARPQHWPCTCPSESQGSGGGA